MSIPFSSGMECKDMGWFCWSINIHKVIQVGTHVRFLNDESRNDLGVWMRNKYVWCLLICWDDWKLVGIYIV